MLADWMKKIADEIGEGSVLTSEKVGAYSIPLNEDTLIEIIEKPEGFTLFCNMCPCPIKREEEFFSEMLQGNLFGKATAGAVLGLSGDGKRVTASREISSYADYKEFRDALEDFMNVVDFWLDEMREVTT